ncbi:MAG: DUF4422 domain-containing protein [Lachnospiraceae bacterium]|nr:DUF4422 domain-containing protein [Lachnospiraceae bacterium]
MEDLIVLVATNKEYRMPSDTVYRPIQAGSHSDTFDGFLQDHTGDNIADRNRRLCELTAAYWAWKNLKCRYIGLTHYRRHFTDKTLLQRIGKDKFDCIAAGRSLEKELEKDVVIVPNKRRYCIETMESHFLHLPYTFEKDFRVLRQVIGELSPAYLDSYDEVMNRTWGTCSICLS